MYWNCIGISPINFWGKLTCDFKTPNVFSISLFMREMKLGCELPWLASWGQAVEPVDEKQGNSAGRSSKGRARRLFSC